LILQSRQVQSIKTNNINNKISKIFSDVRILSNLKSMNMSTNLETPAIQMEYKVRTEYIVRYKYNL